MPGNSLVPASSVNALSAVFIGYAFNALAPVAAEIVGNVTDAAVELVQKILPKKNEALEQAIKNLELNPHDAKSHVDLAFEYLKLGKKEEAEQVLTKVYEINSGPINFCNYLVFKYVVAFEKSASFIYEHSFEIASTSLALFLGYQLHANNKFDKEFQKNNKLVEKSISNLLDISFAGDDYEALKGILQKVPTALLKNSIGLAFACDSRNITPLIEQISGEYLADDSTKKGLLINILGQFRELGREENSNVFANLLKNFGVQVLNKKNQPLLHELLNGEVGINYVDAALKAITSKNKEEEKKKGVEAPSELLYNARVKKVKKVSELNHEK